MTIPDYKKNWDCQEIRIDQHNGYGLRVFRIIKAMDLELEKTTIAKGPDQSSNMTEEYARK